MRQSSDTPRSHAQRYSDADQAYSMLRQAQDEEIRTIGTEEFNRRVKAARYERECAWADLKIHVANLKLED
jgi:hypothetical protein